MKIALAASTLVAGLLAGTSLSYAKPEYTKKEKVNCVICHVANGKKELNDTGKCYGDNKHSLATCKVAKK